MGCAALIVITISLNIYAGESCAITAGQALAKGDTQAALIYYEKAVEKNSLNASYRKELGKLYSSTTPTTTQSLKLASHHFQKAVHLVRGDAELRVLYASTLFQSGQPEEGVRHLETAVLLRPLEQEFYEDLALGYVTAGRLLLNEPTQDEPPQKGANSKATSKERKERARTYLRRTMSIPQLLEKRSTGINKRHLRYWSGAPYLGITPKMQLYCGQAAVLLGDRKAALHYLEQAAQDASLKAEAELWQSQL
jgi:tetratricopeptide (TPR) repeat protein